MSDFGSSMPDTESSAPRTADVGETGETMFERDSETPCVASDCLSNGSVRNSPVTVRERQGPLTDPEPMDSKWRTIEWITQLSVPSLSEAAITDMTSLTSEPQNTSFSPEDHMTDLSVTCDSDPSTVVTVPANVSQPDPALNTMTQTDNTSVTLHTVDQTSPTPCGHASTQTQVRSRFGGLVKPVNRLIQTMSRQDVVQDKFNVKAVCKSMFQAFAD